jgi:regulator of replication initiation timing
MKHIELDTPIEEMEIDDLRTTFSAVMDAHDENLSQTETLEGEKAEYAEQVEALETELEEVKTYFAEKASETTTLDVEILCDRFSLAELQDMAAEAEEQAVSDADDDEPEGKFSEKPEKGVVPEQTTYSDAARERLSRIPGLALRD